MGVEVFGANPQALNGPTLSDETYKPTSNYDIHLAKFAGLARYGLVRDVDQQSFTSSDDASSVVDSVFSDQDTQSIVSSQSSQESTGSDSSEDNSDNEHATPKNADAKCHKIAPKDISTQREELLSGLHSETLPFRTLPQNNKKPETLSNTTTCQNSVGSQTQDYDHLARRRSGAECSVAVPPRLRRDTESSECLVGQLISFATRLITAIWPLSACPPMMSSSFNGAGVLPLEVFINETLRRSKTSFSTLQVALWYLVLLKCQFPAESANGSSDCRAIQCGRRMFLAALMLASKYLQDRNYSTRAWSKISGLRMCEINENEMNYLKVINYSLHVKKEVFDNWQRLVIQLSKLSKAKPGCSTYGWTANDLPGSGHQHSLAAMVSDTSQPRLDLFTCQWWHDVLRQLKPELCNDASCVDGFLHKILPHNMISDPRAHPGDATYPSDIAFNEGQIIKGSQSGTSTPVEYTQSPAEVATALPMQPQLRNLPTPVSTPRQSDSSSWLFRSADSNAPNLRCSASIDAFRNVRKQCFANANLERCPPPRPQSYHCSNMRMTASSQIRSTALPSPATTISDARSRSSSISSTSSWSPSSNVAGLDQLLQYRTQEPSPLTRVVSMPESRYPSKAPNSDHGLRRKPQCSDIATARASAAAQTGSNLRSESRSSAAAVSATSEKKDVDAQIAAALLQMANEREAAAHRVRSSCFEARGHKRTISTSNGRHNENNKTVEQQTSAGQETGEDIYKQPSSLLDLHKGWQYPSKSWATPKKPMPRVFDSKRMALHCASRDIIEESAASQQAGLYLQNHSVFG